MSARSFLSSCLVLNLIFLPCLARPAVADDVQWSNTENRPPLPDPVPEVPPEKECDFYQVSASFYHSGDGFNHSAEMFTGKNGSTTDSLYNLDCIQDIFTHCGVPDGKELTSTGFEKFRDDCVFLELTKIAGLDCGTMSNKALECAHSGQRCKSVPDQVRGGCEHRSINILFDESCDKASVTKTSKKCDEYAALGLYSPLSLLWGAGTEINDFYSIIEYQMNPHEAARWHTWRGSAATPLVVYDPDHTGKVTSGAQLFGEWTWGGKHYASLKDLFGGAPRAKWDNAYDALGQLDANRDDAIDGEELAPIALWFDRNQDGVSQPGEVVSAKDAKLTRLFLNHGSYDPAKQAISAPIGFERELNGKTVRGGSVDWYGETAASKMEMLLREQARTSLDIGKLPLPDSADAPRPTAALNGDPLFNGVWVWQLEGENALSKTAPSSGLLQLSYDPETGQVRGGSFLQVAMRSQTGKRLVKLTRLPIEGETVGDASERRIKIRIYDNKKEVSRANVVLSADGTQLTGESTTSVRKAPGSDQANPFEYRWIAKRR